MTFFFFFAWHCTGKDSYRIITHNGIIFFVYQFYFFYNYNDFIIHLISFADLPTSTYSTTMITVLTTPKRFSSETDTVITTPNAASAKTETVFITSNTSCTKRDQGTYLMISFI